MMIGPQKCGKALPRIGGRIPVGLEVMNEGDLLLRAIAATPEDDSVRLVYADWLEERGESARAEFIRIQIELAQTSADSPNRSALQARAAELLQMHERSWTPENKLALFFEWKRGFVTVLNPCARGVFNGEDSLKVLAEFFLAEELQFGFCMSDKEFSHMPELPNLRLFGVGGNVRITDDSIPRIGRWSNLRRLRLNVESITDAALPHLVGLTSRTCFGGKSSLMSR